jgi:SAM-dependent methyltransferase
MSAIDAVRNITAAQAIRARWRLEGLWERVRLGSPRGIPVADMRLDARHDEVEAFWTAHTVRDEAFRAARESSEYLEWRFAEYPLLREFMALWGQHDGHTVLDYGCGPGNDTTGFLIGSNAARVIGMDVSPRALALCRQRLMLHRVDPDRVRLFLVSDSEPRIPLEDGSVDHVNCGGVLHHTSFPDELLAEFYRVLRPGGTANIMVYGHDSIFVHLYVGYILRLRERRFDGTGLDDAFAACADGGGCPIARAYLVEDFSQMCRAAGLEVDYVGGYLSLDELRWLRHDLDRALASELEEESKGFLSSLTMDSEGMPMHQGKYAGLSGVYRLFKPA